MERLRILILLTIATTAFGISFQLPVGVKKCLREEVHRDVLVVGEYHLSDAPMQQTNLEVRDSENHILYKKEDASKGKFAFTTDNYDMFEVCLESRMTGDGHGYGAEREATVTLKHGVEAKNYAELGKAEKLKPLEIELRKLEDLSESIVKDFAYMRSREEEMRDTNESTNTRVLYFSIFSMVCLLGLAVWQVFYLRRYFKAKKLIE
ncbi:transmembrane emp24 domain-containing protein 10-like [Corticium candelabrum]|uniref:transmembrane emp24 domain-containing protein 10-like n=1 Tax=Corticium candelabrum TaxID=121492 RepID=UPI002E257F7B|nr:transmembrane emp24 domain-containing protein 10-like [Corticium candelabrum]